MSHCSQILFTQIVCSWQIKLCKGVFNHSESLQTDRIQSHVQIGILTFQRYCCPNLNELDSSYPVRSSTDQENSLHAGVNFTFFPMSNPSLHWTVQFKDSTLGSLASFQTIQNLLLFSALLWFNPWSMDNLPQYLHVHIKKRVQYTL